LRESAVRLQHIFHTLLPLWLVFIPLHGQAADINLVLKSQGTYLMGVTEYVFEQRGSSEDIFGTYELNLERSQFVADTVYQYGNVIQLLFVKPDIIKRIIDYHCGLKGYQRYEYKQEDKLYFCVTSIEDTVPTFLPEAIKRRLKDAYLSISGTNPAQLVIELALNTKKPLTKNGFWDRESAVIYEVNQVAAYTDNAPQHNQGNTDLPSFAVNLEEGTITYYL